MPGASSTNASSFLLTVWNYLYRIISYLFLNNSSSYCYYFLSNRASIRGLHVLSSSFHLCMASFYK